MLFLITAVILFMFLHKKRYFIVPFHSTVLQSFYIFKSAKIFNLVLQSILIKLEDVFSIHHEFHEVIQYPLELQQVLPQQVYGFY